MCPIRVSRRRFFQERQKECQARMSHKSVLQGCPTRVLKRGSIRVRGFYQFFGGGFKEGMYDGFIVAWHAMLMMVLLVTLAND